MFIKELLILSNVLLTQQQGWDISYTDTDPTINSSLA